MLPRYSFYASSWVLEKNAFRQYLLIYCFYNVDAYVDSQWKKFFLVNTRFKRRKKLYLCSGKYLRL